MMAYVLKAHDKWPTSGTFPDSTIPPKRTRKHVFERKPTHPLP